MYTVTERNLKNTVQSLVCTYKTIVECLVATDGRLHQVHRENFERKEKGLFIHSPKFRMFKVDSSIETYPSKSPRILEYLEKRYAR